MPLAPGAGAGYAGGMSPLSDADLRQRLAFAHRIAVDTGRRLVGLRDSGRWAEPKLLGDIGDQAADAYLQGSLRAAYPEDGILSEETVDAPERLQRRCTWIVDPLDGTKEYSSGRHDWAVHVGLAVDGAPVLGVVALPAIGRCLSARRGGAATLSVDGERNGSAAGSWPERLAAVAAPPRPRLVVSRSHTPTWVERLGQGLGGVDVVPCGSVGFKVAMLLFGRADVYVHDQGLKEWDTCAPEVVANAAGFVVRRLDGSVQVYNRPDPRNGQIVVARPELSAPVLAQVAALGMR
jgi:3'(2'), 5'-bisphosphate nucleotidase